MCSQLPENAKYQLLRRIRWKKYSVKVETLQCNIYSITSKSPPAKCTLSIKNKNTHYAEWPLSYCYIITVYILVLLLLMRCMCKLYIYILVVYAVLMNHFVQCYHVLDVKPKFAE